MTHFESCPLRCIFIINDERITFYLRFPPHPIKLKIKSNQISNDQVQTVELDLNDLISNTLNDNIKDFLTTLFNTVESSYMLNNDISCTIHNMNEAIVSSYFYPSIIMHLSFNIDMDTLFNILDKYNVRNIEMDKGVKFSSLLQQYKDFPNYCTIDSIILEKILYMCIYDDIYSLSYYIGDILKLPDKNVEQFLLKHLYSINESHSSLLSKYVKLRINKIVNINEPYLLYPIISNQLFKEGVYTLIDKDINEQYRFDTNMIIVSDLLKGIINNDNFMTKILDKDIKTKLCKIPHNKECNIIYIWNLYTDINIDNFIKSGIHVLCTITIPTNNKIDH